MSARQRKRSTRSADTWSCARAMFPCAANWSRGRKISKPKCSTPTRGASSGSKYIAATIAGRARARGASCRPWSRRRQHAPRHPRRRATKRCGLIRTLSPRREAEVPDQHHRPILGLAALADRFRGGRTDGAGDGAVQSLADPLPDVVDAGLAHRRHWRRALARFDGCSADRLVVRLWLFSRRSLLDRLCLPRRRRGVRLAAADRGVGLAGRARAFHRLWRRPRALVMDARSDAHFGFGGGT